MRYLDIDKLDVVGQLRQFAGEQPSACLYPLRRLKPGAQGANQCENNEDAYYE
jgi:hypothetical protein